MRAHKVYKVSQPELRMPQKQKVCFGVTAAGAPGLFTKRMLAKHLSLAEATNPSLIAEAAQRSGFILVGSHGETF